MRSLAVYLVLACFSSSAHCSTHTTTAVLTLPASHCNEPLQLGTMEFCNKVEWLWLLCALLGLAQPDRTLC
jgi:hypothetical protein